MKLILLSIFILHCCNLSEQYADILNCTHGERHLEEPEKTCVRLTCTSRTSYSVLGCGSKTCDKGKILRHKYVDHSKIYPECCGFPICRE